MRIQDQIVDGVEEADPFEDIEDEGEVEDGNEEGDNEEMAVSGTVAWTEGKTVGERILKVADLTERFSRAVRYQADFHDARFLATLERESRAFVRLANACLEHERAANSTRTANPRTWGPDSSYTVHHVLPVSSS
jgi:hypothetical protein